MKTSVLLTSLIFLLVLAGSSCRKDHVCNCTVTYVDSTRTFSNTYINTFKLDAQADCTADQTYYNSIDPNGHYACSLK